MRVRLIDACLPQYKFPSTWHVTHSDNHWSNETTMKQYVEKIILPYVNDKRKELKLPHDQPALLIFDNFKAQTTSSILKLLDSHNLDIVLLPANCTDRLQPLDLSINKAAKDFYVCSSKNSTPRNYIYSCRGKLKLLQLI